MDASLVLAVAIACGLASAIRYALSLAVAPHGFPWSTVVVNTAGTAVLAAALALDAYEQLGSAAVIVIGVGFAGGLTTFSTLATDAVRLWRAGSRQEAAVYLALTLGLGLLASFLTWSITVAVVA